MLHLDTRISSKIFAFKNLDFLIFYFDLDILYFIFLPCKHAISRACTGQRNEADGQQEAAGARRPRPCALPAPRQCRGHQSPRLDGTDSAPARGHGAGSRPRRRCGRPCRDAHPVIPLIPRRRGRRGAAGIAGTVHSGHMTAPEPDADQAITAIYGSEYRSLVRLAVVLVGDVGAAEEIVQDSFVAMRGAWRRLQDRDKALSYLWQSVVTRSRSTRRRAAAGPPAPAGAPRLRSGRWRDHPTPHRPPSYPITPSRRSGTPRRG